MKKTIRKLMLRKATVRELSGQALSRAVGGQETDPADAYRIGAQAQHASCA